jgi:hypothetical protein
MMIGLPVLTAVMGCAFWGIQVGVAQFRLDHDVALQARYASLGGDVPSSTAEGNLVCVEGERVVTWGGWALEPIILRAHSCALNPRGDRDHELGEG